MTFPTTPILDNFNRGDEGPPPSANWITPGDPGDFNGLRVVSNQMTTDSGKSNGWSYWNTVYGPDCEFYFTIPNLLGINPSIQFYFRLNNPIAGGVTKGYYLYIISGEIDLIRYSGFSILHTEVMTVPSGDKVGVSAVGSLITVYYNNGSGWVELFNETDSNYTGSGYTAFYLNNVGLASPSNIIDDFGGGTLAAAPIADFSGTPLAGGAPLSVAFTDASTGSPTSWLWDFGDSSTSTDQNPTHIYNADGVYTVALTATNDGGDDTETKVDYITVASPVADFSGTPTSGAVALSVDFTDTSTNTPTSWFWDFGDGGSSTDQNPTYVYNYIGTYTVTLTASNGSGSDSETKAAYITVTAVVEYGAAVIENCDIDTGGTAIGLRVADVAIARDNRLGSITVDASAELRAKDNSYTTLVNNGTLQPLAGDRAVFDALGYSARHTNDSDDSATAIHHTLGTGADQAAAGNHTHSGSLSNALTDTHIFVGNVSNIAADVAMSNDATMANTGALTLATVNSNVGSFTNANITVNAKGLVTAAADGSGGGAINVYNETITADGISTIYYLLNTASPSTIRVYIDGIRQPASDDAAPTDVVSFSVAPDLGAVLLFDYEMDLT